MADSLAFASPQSNALCEAASLLMRMYNHKWKLEFDVDSLVQAIVPPGPVEDEVDTYESLALAGRVSELSNAATPEHSDFVLS